jgi:hypothetical protein
MDLGFEEKPNYDFYRQLFRQLYKKERFDKLDGGEALMDWEVITKRLKEIKLEKKKKKLQ